jgi:hypothetical protein
VTPAPGGRDGRGRFTAGNPGGPGNPFARRVAALRSRLVRAVTNEVLDAVVGQLVSRARGGDLAAIKLLLSYTLGRPAESVNPDTLDLEEFRLYERDRDIMETVSRLVKALTPAFACRLLRAVRPEVLHDIADAMTRAMRASLVPEHLDAVPGSEGPAGDTGVTAPRKPAPSPNGCPAASSLAGSTNQASRPATAPSPNGAKPGTAPSTNGGNGHSAGPAPASRPPAGAPPSGQAGAGQADRDGPGASGSPAGGGGKSAPDVPGQSGSLARSGSPPGGRGGAAKPSGRPGPRP